MTGTRSAKIAAFQPGALGRAHQGSRHHRCARCSAGGQDLTAQRAARKPPTRCEPVRPGSR